METSSPNSLPPSSPLSFHSIKDFHSSSQRPNTADASLRQYRGVQRLPYELREHCMIYFEEGLYIPAINLLVSLLTAGTALNPPIPAFLPPSQHLALVSTLAIHPSLTIRAKSKERLEASNLAMKYLWLVLELVGPVNGDLQHAFSFSSIGTSSRRGGSGRRRTAEEADPILDDLNGVNSELATTGALWSRAEDFWQVVGWAFNCSVLHKKRWEGYSLWLEYMINVLEKDWQVRGRNAAKDQDDDHDPRMESMIVRYLSSEGAMANREKKILRAIFADAGSRTLTEFPEIWRNETKERKKDKGGATKKRETKIDIEEDNYGDYMSEDSESAFSDSPNSPPNPLPPTRTTSTSTATPNTSSPLGGQQSITLRLRLLSLLSAVSFHLPHAITPLSTLYDIYLEHIRPLPIPTFFLILSPSSLSIFAPAAASSLTQFILRSMIASQAPLPTKDDLEQDVLERAYLPWAANGGGWEVNVRVSICAETLLRLLHKHVGLVWSEELEQAMQRGIEAREAKARMGTKKKEDAEEGRRWLQGSAGRIRGLVDGLKPSGKYAKSIKE